MGHIHPCSPAYLILITREPCLLPELLDRTDGGGGEGRVDGGEVDKWGSGVEEGGLGWLGRAGVIEEISYKHG